MRETFKIMLDKLKNRRPSEHSDGRKGSGYTIADAVSDGAAILAKEWSKPRRGGGDAGEREQLATEEGDPASGEALEEDAVELTEEDLSVDGMLV